MTIADSVFCRSLYGVPSLVFWLSPGFQFYSLAGQGAHGLGTIPLADVTASNLVASGRTKCSQRRARMVPTDIVSLSTALKCESMRKMIKDRVVIEARAR